MALVVADLAILEYLGLRRIAGAEAGKLPGGVEASAGQAHMGKEARSRKPEGKGHEGKPGGEEEDVEPSTDQPEKKEWFHQLVSPWVGPRTVIWRVNCF